MRNMMKERRGIEQEKEEQDKENEEGDENY